MVIDDHRAAMGCDETLLTSLGEEAAGATNIIRFHATRPMTDDSAKTIVLLELSSRAHALHKALLAVSGHPVLSLVSASLKPEGTRRTPRHRPWPRDWGTGKRPSG